MKIFVISLKDAMRRRAAAVEQLEATGLEYDFFDAIENVTCPSRYFSGFNTRLYRLNTRRDALPGEIGCYASHLSLWRTCVAMNQPITILEDDFQLEDEFTDAIHKIATLTNTFGFIRLQSFDRRQVPKKLRRAAQKVLSLNGFQLYYLSDIPLNMLAYAISPQAASSLLSASATLTAPIDKFVQQSWVHKTPIYALSPAVVGPSSHAATSTIGDRSQKSRNVGLLLVRALYKGLGELRRISFDRKQLSLLGMGATPRPHGLQLRLRSDTAGRNPDG